MCVREREGEREGERGVLFHLFMHSLVDSLLKILINLFLEREEGREKERERNTNRLPLAHAPARDQAHNPGMCPDQESNWQHFTLQSQGRWLILVCALTRGRSYNLGTAKQCSNHKIAKPLYVFLELLHPLDNVHTHGHI